MQLEMSVVIGVVSGIVPAGISFGASMAKISKLERDEERGFQLQQKTHEKLDELATRLTKIEAKLEKERT